MTLAYDVGVILFAIGSIGFTATALAELLNEELTWITLTNIVSSITFVIGSILFIDFDKIKEFINTKNSVTPEEQNKIGTEPPFAMNNQVRLPDWNTEFTNHETISHEFIEPNFGGY